MKWIVVLVGASSVLAACVPPWPDGKPVAERPVVAHCYITLAEVECYAAPQTGQEYRQMGSRATSPR